MEFSRKEAGMKTLMRFFRPGSKVFPVAVVLSFLALIAFSTPALAAPGITISPAIGAQGTVTSISGTLFDSYRGDTVYVFFHNTQIEYSPFSVPDTGTFEIPFVVPEGTPAGTYQVKVASDYNGLVKIAETVFTVEATGLYLDIVKGPVETSITISGKGFYADTDVIIYFYTPSPIQAGIEKASDIGRFDFHYTIPPCIAGPHIIAVGNGKGNQAEAAFEVIPVVTLDTASGGPGEQVKGTGSGFGPKKNYTVTIGTRNVASGATDETGSFEFNFFVPNIKANLYEITAMDADGNTDTDKFTVTAGAALSPDNGHIGSETTVRGEGFIPGGTITIHFDSQLMLTVTADNNGGFAASFTIPEKSTGGPHTVSVSDGTTAKEFTYTVETIAPPAPALLLPVNDSQTSRSITFDWNDTSDDSLPVTYDLQVSEDQSFSSIFVEKYGLSTSSYTLTESERPAGAEGPVTYYWRVRAIDGAGNEGKWSTMPWSFHISPPDAPVLKTAVPGAAGDELLLDWEDTSSANGPVTYVLEISDDQAFGTVEIREEGITTSDYMLSGTAYSSLERDTPYFWRVKAIDTASVSGDWSENGIFSIAKSSSSSSSAFPSWAIFAIAGVGVIIIAYLAFRMGRRTGGDRGE